MRVKVPDESRIPYRNVIFDEPLEGGASNGVSVTRQELEVCPGYVL